MKTLIVLLFAFCFAAPAFAHDDDDKPRPPAPAKTWDGGPNEDNHREAFWAGVVTGGLAVTAFQKTEHPWLYSVAASSAIALAANAASSSVDAKETRYAIAGAIAGATGVGLVFGKNFFGWQTAIKF